VRFEIRDVRGKKHLYLVESERTPKGPRRTQQIYIGTPESVLERLARPHQEKSYALGRSLALLHAAQATGLLEALNHHVPHRGRGGPSIAQQIFLQILGRAEAPLSRARMERAFAHSPLLSLLGFTAPPSARTLLRSLRKLFGTGRQKGSRAPLLSRARVRRIEADVFRNLMQKGLDPRWLIFDTTNHFVHHQEGTFPKKGKSKDHRSDKNLLGLGLVTAGPVPVLSEVTAGNEADPKVFARVFDALLRRLMALEVATERMVLVFDRGINSTENFDNVLGAMHVIAALDRQEARRLLARPLTEFRKVGVDGEGKAILGLATHWEGFARVWRVLVTYREATARNQQARWERTRERVLERVGQWRGGSGGRREAAVMAKLVDLIPKEYRSIFEYGVENKDGAFWPRCKVNLAGEERLRSSWGKTAILTDLTPQELSDEELVKGWVGRATIEEDFRWLKDRYVMSVKPVWVWHDEAIPGHVFLCVMGLMLLRYLQWEARDLGLTIPGMLEALGEVRGVVWRTPEGKPTLLLERMEGLQQQLANRWKFHEVALG